MNSKIKSASIVLTGGVLLGWGSSAALAANVVGVGMYGINGDARMSGDDASDAISYDENGYVMISYGSTDGLTLENDNRTGEMITVNIDSQGSGYLASEAGVANPILVDNTGNTGVNAEWYYDVDGTIGAYLEDYVDVNENAAGNIMTGTGYVSNSGALIGDLWHAGIAFKDDAGTAGPVCTGDTPWDGDQAVFGAGSSPGFEVEGDAANPCNAWAGATADAKGEICEIDLLAGGVGYGVAGGIMDVYVNGVLSTDYIGAYTTVAGTGEINGLSLTKNDAPAADYPTNWDQVTFMPQVSTGTGFDAECYLWGEFAGWTNFRPGVGCTEVNLASHELEANLMNNCTNCTIVAIIGGGEGCSITAGPIPVGAIESTTIVDSGFNYDHAPAVGPLATITAGTGATFTSVIGAANYYVTYEDGMPLEFDYDDGVSLYCGADYNNDDHADIVAHGTVDGYGETICLLLGENGVVNEIVEYGESGTDWHIAGQLDRGGADYADGHCLLWRNNATGGNAVWVCNGDGVVEKSLIEAAAAEEWFCYCTNDSLGGGSRAYWYSHYGDNAMWYMDIDTDHNDWVTEMDYLRNDVGARVNTGTGAGWEMEAVGCLSGDPGDDNLSRDIVWSNAGTGAVCIWLMDQDASGYINSRNYCTVGGNVYNGASGYGVAEGYRCVGVGQYEVSTRYGTAADGGGGFDTLTRDQMWGTLWWNHNGSSYAWKMDRTVNLELWGPAGNTGGTGLPEYPETVSAYERY